MFSFATSYSNLIDIRTARFLEEFTINEDHVCTLFVRNAQCSLAKIFSILMI